jgi:uncharacterized protein YdeI (YjbR/CyaY-like superfamily)
VTYAEALDVALCWGWIDGQKASLNEQYFLQRFTPRRARSVWSKTNRGHVARLTEAGRMQPPGLAQVQAAREDGRWDAAYDSPANMEVPPELAAALAANPRASAFFETISRVNRYALCHRVQTARKPETRRARAEKYVAMLERGEVPYPS